MRALARSDRAVLAQRAAVAQRARAPEVRTLPAPSGGWNARDSWDAMKPEDAIELENFYPGFGQVDVRKGFEEFAALDTTDTVETLATLDRSDGETLIAAANNSLWDATASGTISTALSAGFTSDRWQWAVMNDTLGLVNGADAPQTWDGTTLGAMTVAAATGEPALTVANLVGINVFKSRSYFWESASQNFWYSAVNTLGGDLEQFPLGDVGSFGGHLIAMVTWTRDGGDGMDDFAVFLMSSGEAIVYQGSDPGSATDWLLVGIFRIGALLGIRAAAKAGGDVLLATRDGYGLLSRMLPGGRGARGTTVTDKITPAVLEQIRQSGDDFGWQVLHYPRGRRVMINYPIGPSFQQHVVNLDTGAWCKFTGMDARCWTVFDNSAFFGGENGKIYKADTGVADDGAAITAKGRQAFNYLGTRNTNKQIRMVRPILQSGTSVEADIGLAADFNPTPHRVSITLGTLAEGGDDWDTAEWDLAEWAPETQTVGQWVPHIARGYAISPSVEVQQEDRQISWAATNIMFERVGPI